MAVEYRHLCIAQVRPQPPHHPEVESWLSVQARHGDSSPLEFFSPDPQPIQTTDTNRFTTKMADKINDKALGAAYLQTMDEIHYAHESHRHAADGWGYVSCGHGKVGVQNCVSGLHNSRRRNSCERASWPPRLFEAPVSELIFSVRRLAATMALPTCSVLRPPAVLP